MGIQGGTHRYRIDKGFDVYKSVDNTAKPGVLIRSTTSGKTAYLTQIFITNTTGSSQTVTFYDENSVEKLVLIVDNNKTTEYKIAFGIPFNDVDIYARTNSGTVDITIVGMEI